MKNTRPAFGRIFAKKALAGAAIAAAVAAAALTALSLTYRSSGDDYLFAAYQQCENRIEESLAEYGENLSDDGVRRMLCSVNFKMAGALSPAAGEARSIYCRMADIQTGETLADSTERMFIVLKSDAGSGTVYVSPDNAQIIAAYRELSARAKRNKDSSVECISVYLKGSEAYPRLALLTREDGSLRVVESRDFAPADTEGCVYLEKTPLVSGEDGTLRCSAESGEYVWCAAGTERDSRAANTLERYIAQNGMTVPWGDAHNYGGCLIDGYSVQLAFPDGARDVIIYYSGTDSFIGDYSAWICAAGGALLAAALLIALFAARAQYSRENAQYEILNARRETTNAMAHDLKTPLASISGYAEILGEDINPEKRAYYIERIGENVRQMNSTVGDILKLAKSESCSAELKPEEFSAAAVVRGIVSALALFEKRGLVCNISGDTSLNTDRAVFSQAVLNLMQNAALYSAENSEVSVEITARSLKISNIPEKAPNKSAEELMKPFVRGSDARGENEGSGIGLAIARADLERLGFRLRIEAAEIFTAECVFSAKEAKD